MMSGHGSNLIFFNKIVKNGRSEHLLHPLPNNLCPITSHFCLTRGPSFPPQAGRHTCIAPNMFRINSRVIYKKTEPAL